MAKKNQWVIKYRNIWAVKGEGNKKVTRITKTQKEAVDIAKRIAKNQKSELYIQNREGKIRSKDSYGHDPCPPENREH